MSTQQQSAYDALKKQLQVDDDMAWGYLCNIAMAIYDTMQPADTHQNKHRFANLAAARTMHRIFDVDVTKHRHWNGFMDGWKLLDGVNVSNQCDGCMKGDSVNERGNHVDRHGKPYMGCQAGKYAS